MGALLIDAHTKGFTDMRAMSASEMKQVDREALSPALRKLLEALRESDSTGAVPVEVIIRIKGREDRTFSVELDDVAELQEVLQWTIGRD